MNKEIVQKLIEYLEQTENFVLQQAPEVIQEVLNYHRISYYLTAAILFTLITAIIAVAIYFWKFPTIDKFGSRDFFSVLSIIIPVYVVPFLFIQLLITIDKIIKIHISPKYFLMEVLASLNR